ncbi:MAG: hypothetical protein J2P25_21710, partial [Nocardiopsaceae bacterium]|nr:hypothetical protein [Nocardiopsaceae bacterium]
ARCRAAGPAATAEGCRAGRLASISVPVIAGGDDASDDARYDMVVGGLPAVRLSASRVRYGVLPWDDAPCWGTRAVPSGRECPGQFRAVPAALGS